jgi:hypothetical protein
MPTCIVEAIRYQVMDALGAHVCQVHWRARRLRCFGGHSRELVQQIVHQACNSLPGCPSNHHEVADTARHIFQNILRNQLPVAPTVEWLARARMR